MLVKAPIFSEVYQNVDETELNDKQASLIDGYLDELGATVRRPGLDEFTDLGSGTGPAVSGLYWWSDKECVIAVCGGDVYKVDYSAHLSQVTATDLGGEDVTADSPVTFDDDGTYCFIACDDKILYTNGTAAVAAIGSNAPDQVSHVACMDGYVLCNRLDSNKNQYHYSNVNTPLTWSALNYFSASGDSDPVTALKVLNRSS